MTARELIWTAIARQELSEIGEFIARDKPVAASRWVETLMEAAERAAVMPLVGRRVPEFNRDDLREVIKRGYRIVYLVVGRDSAGHTTADLAIGKPAGSTYSN